MLDFPSLASYAEKIYQLDAFKKSTNFKHIKRNYFYSHTSINPHRIVPQGPEKYIGNKGSVGIVKLMN